MEGGAEMPSDGAVYRSSVILELNQFEDRIAPVTMERLRTAIRRLPAARPKAPSASWEEFTVYADHQCKDGTIRKLRRKKFRCSNCHTQTAIRSDYCTGCGHYMNDEGWDYDDE